jgi:hypothetical protein
MENEKDKTENEEDEKCGTEKEYAFSFPEGTKALGVIIYDSLDELKKDMPELKDVKDEFNEVFIFFIGIKKETLSITEERKKRERKLLNSIEEATTFDEPPRKVFILYPDVLQDSEKVE